MSDVNPYDLAGVRKAVAKSRVRRMMMADVAAQPVEIDRIATLEADLAVSRERETALAAECATANEKRDWAVAVLDSVRSVLESAQEINPSNYDHEQVCDLNTKMCEAYAVVSEPDIDAFLAAHDAEVGRENRVDALEEVLSWIHPDGNPACLADRVERLIAALKEGVKA